MEQTASNEIHILDIVKIKAKDINAIANYLLSAADQIDKALPIEFRMDIFKRIMSLKKAASGIEWFVNEDENCRKSLSDS